MRVRVIEAPPWIYRLQEYSLQYCKARRLIAVLWSNQLYGVNYLPFDGQLHSSKLSPFVRPLLSNTIYFRACWLIITGSVPTGTRHSGIRVQPGCV